MRKIVRALTGLALLAVLVTVVAACGSGSSTSSSVSTESSGSSTEGGESAPPKEEAESGSGGKAAAAKFVTEHSDLAKIEYPQPPEEPYDPGTGRVGIVTCSLGQGAQGCVEMGEEAVKAAKAAGWEPTEVLDGEFNPAVQGKRVQQLLQEKVDAIVLISIQPETIAGAINEAISAGVPITDIYTSPDKVFKSWGEPLTMVTSSGLEQGEFVGKFIAANIGEMKKVNVLGNSPEFPILIERTEGVEKALGEDCPECEVEVTDMASAELAKPGPPPLNALLTTNPAGTMEWFLGGPTDPYGGVMLETIEQSGRGEEIKMVGVDTGATVLENMAKGGIVQADVYSPFRYAAWAGMDEVIREAAGLKPWRADRLPPAYVTSENVEEALSETPKSFNTPGFDYEAMFKELWSGK